MHCKSFILYLRFLGNQTQGCRTSSYKLPVYKSAYIQTILCLHVSKPKNAHSKLFLSSWRKPCWFSIQKQEWNIKIHWPMWCSPCNFHNSGMVWVASHRARKKYGSLGNMEGILLGSYHQIGSSLGSQSRNNRKLVPWWG